MLGIAGSLEPDDLMRTVTTRGEQHTAQQAINRQIAHYARHGGQVIFLAKHLGSNTWKTRSLPRGKSTEINTRPSKKFERGVPGEKQRPQSGEFTSPGGRGPVRTPPHLIPI